MQQGTSQSNSKNENMPFILVIGFLLILLIISFIFNMMKCDDIRGRINLDELYKDFKGNDDPNSRMTATVDISTKEGACSFEVFYEYDGYREVTSNYITAPLAREEEEEIAQKISEIIDEAEEGDIDEIKQNIKDEYDIDKNKLKNLRGESNEIKDIAMEIVIEKVQNDKDICKRYQYPNDEGELSKAFLNRLLDDDYLERHVK